MLDQENLVNKYGSCHMESMTDMQGRQAATDMDQSETSDDCDKETSDDCDKQVEATSSIG